MVTYKLKDDMVWKALVRRLGKFALGISGRTHSIKEIPKNENEIGYTTQDGTIYLSRSHSLVLALEDKLQSMFVSGVFAHELMHQLDTDFSAFIKEQNKLPVEAEKKIFVTIFNCLEDPAIEYWASYYFGGTLLKALRFSVKHIYDKTLSINQKNAPFAQFVSAIIHYGDGGLVKGTLCEEAKPYFAKALPILDKAIEEPDGAVRVRYAKEIFDLSKPLWEKELDELENLKELMHQLEQVTKENGKSSAKNSSSSHKPLGDREKEKSPDDSDDAKKAKRKITFREISKEEAENAEPFDSLPEESIEIGISDTDIDDISDEDISELERELASAINELLKEAQKDTESKVPLGQASELPSCYPPTVNCLNQQGKPNSAEIRYAQIVRSIQTGINSLTAQLQRLFQNDREEKIYKASGRISIKRLSDTRMTSRVFERRIEPADKSDISVMIAVDTSGSMYGRKVETAIKAVIGLSEVFGNLNVPVSVMTFSADENGYDAIHTHYLNFHNTHVNRLCLQNISAGGNNFDGYSVRYAGSVMKKRQEKHKIIIVISDGQPACEYYWQHDGIQDTKNAVREARKNAAVIGIAIDANAEILHTIYEDKFIHIKNVNQLFEVLGDKIKKEIMLW